MQQKLKRSLRKSLHARVLLWVYGRKLATTQRRDKDVTKTRKFNRHSVLQHEEKALVDTGAVHVVISQQISQKLGLQILNHQGVKFADGRKETVGVTQAILIECEGRRTIEDALVVGNSILIGQVVLES